MEDKQKIVAFLREYIELCQRHGLFVGGNWDPDGLFVDTIDGTTGSGLDDQIEDLKLQAGIDEPKQFLGG